MPRKKTTKSSNKGESSDLSVGHGKPTLSSALEGNFVIDKKGKKIAVSTIAKENEVIGLFFGASWSKPCRKFTPLLCQRYVSTLIYIIFYIFYVMQHNNNII